MAKLIDIQPSKACSKCGVVKRLVEYGKRAESADGVTSQCRKCVAAKAKIDTARRRAARGMTTDRKSQRPDSSFGNAALLSLPMGRVS